MAGTALKIDDDYVLDMGTTLSDNETELQSGVDKYLEIMKKIREDAFRNLLLAFNRKLPKKLYNDKYEFWLRCCEGSEEYYRRIGGWSSVDGG